MARRRSSRRGVLGCRNCRKGVLGCRHNIFWKRWVGGFWFWCLFLNEGLNLRKFSSSRKVIPASVPSVEGLVVQKRVDCSINRNPVF